MPLTLIEVTRVFIPWFCKDSDGNLIKILRRHPLNDRQHQTTRNTYKNNILKKGLKVQGRSEAVCFSTSAAFQIIEVDGNKTVVLNGDSLVWFDFASAATVIESGYLAIEEDPENEYVKLMVSTGFGPVTIGDCRRDSHDMTTYDKIMSNVLMLC